MARNDKSRLKAYEQAQQMQEPEKVQLEKVQKLLKCYDSLRQSAARHDTGTVLEILKMLENSLNYEASPLLCWRLQKLYRHIRQCVENGNFPEACRVADELHSMWQGATIS